MRKISGIILSLLIVQSMLLPQFAQAQGSYANWSVAVYASSNAMLGSMNNRYNTSPTPYKTWMGAGVGATDKVVYFEGVDGNNYHFVCQVLPASDLYQMAYDIALNLDNGGVLYVSKEKTSSNCNTVHFSKSSEFLD